MAIQVATTVGNATYKAFDDYRLSQGLNESSALIDLITRFFEEGHKNLPENKLTALEVRILSLKGGV